MENGDDLKEIINELLNDIENNHPNEYFKSFELLKTLFTNIILNPNDPKFRNFKKTNEAIKSRILSIPECLTLLEILGYNTSNEEEFIFEGESLINISNCLQLINTRLRKGNKPSSTFNINKSNSSSNTVNNSSNPSNVENNDYTVLPCGNHTYPENSVIVYQYDLSMGMASGLARSFLGINVEGIWHTSVVFKGQEYFYGGGIGIGNPKQTPYGIPVKELNYGITNKTKEEFKSYIDSIFNNYTIQTYNVLNHNCNHFTDDALFFLTGKHLPDSILKQHETLLNTPLGAMIRPMLEQMSQGGNNAMLPNYFEGNRGNQGGGFGGFGGGNFGGY
ncbi:MAG: hypothetical protein MJ252_18295 [archaeon]|nr:hypothetical protein [archaeon]